MPFPKEQNQAGEFKRQEDLFRKWVSRSGSTGYPAEKGRYHLYVSYACPWAHRTIIVRKLKGLEEIVGMTVVDPVRDDLGWAFREGAGFSKDLINGFNYLSEAYRSTDPDFQQRVTVPVLWDIKNKIIINNSEEDIVRMFNDAFNDLTHNRLDLYPEPLRQEIDLLNEFLYSNINDGVYQAGFATSQTAYEKAVYRLFDALGVMEERLVHHRYLLGDQLTESDWRLFPTLIRFDPVYFGHFKCNLRRIVDYRNLNGYLKELYQMNGIAETVNFDHIKKHYYMTHLDINPTRIVPVGPLLDLTSPHGRG
jgi:putative glutathione S-transferase